MSAEAPDSLQPLLERYLDRQLTPDERAALESRLAADPAAQAEVAQQRQIDAALRRIGRPADPEAIWARIEAAERAGRVTALLQARRRARILRAAVAAALVLAFGGAGALYWQTQRTRHLLEDRQYGEQPWRSYETVYADTVKAGFTADWECKTEKDFARTFRGRFGQGLLLGEVPAGIQTLGLSYCNTLSPKTVILLALVHGEKVIVFIDRPSSYQRAGIAPASGLHMYGKQVGQLILREISPLDRPYLLDLFYDPQKPDSWYTE
jgi:hypothetical protein